MVNETPGDAIRERLGQRGWTQSDLARLIDKTVAAVNEVIQGKRSITPDMAALLGAAFGDPPAYWLTLDAQNRAVSSDPAAEEVRRRVKLYELAPVREIERRGWIRRTDDALGLEQELKRFFGVSSLDDEPTIHVAMRRTDTGEPTSPAQRAWCFRARTIASTLRVKKFSGSALVDCAQRIRSLAAFPEESRKLSGVLADFGIRFVIVEPLAGRERTVLGLLEEERP